MNSGTRKESPIEDFFNFEKESTKVRSQKDLELWEEWVKSGKEPNQMKPLLTQFRGTINSQVNKYRANPNIPKSALKAEFTNRAIEAFDNYDPTRGASLHTHVNWQMMKGRRFVTTYSNVGRIPESRAYKVGEFINARSDLEDKLGREPTAHEMADKLKWPIKHITSLQQEVKREVPTSMLAADTIADKPSREAEVIRLIQYELNPQEKLVLEHTYGLNGKSKLKPGDIAKKLNIPSSKVSRVKLGIATKIKRYM